MMRVTQSGQPAQTTTTTVIQRLRQLTTTMLIVGSTTALCASPPAASAAPLINGLGGTLGFGEGELAANDDLSTGELDLPFAINFFGNTYDHFFVNNNGNISFGGALNTYTPNAFPGAPRPMIAPYWADVDTRNQPGGGRVFYNLDDPSSLVVTWNNVGYYANHNDKLNNFQLVMNDQGSGDFDLEFRYDRLEWTTGDASSGSGGLGGDPAIAGYDSGNGTDADMLPFSGTADVLRLVNTSNVNSNSPGLWRLTVRNGNPDIPDVPGPLPLLGIAAAAGWTRTLRRRLNGVQSGG